MTPLLAQRPRVDRSFERLYRRHVADVYHYALAVLRNPTDAEDVTQTTFLNAYRAYQRGERPQAAQNWLIAIAHNVCRQRFRQSTRRPQEVAFDEDVADAIVDDDAPSAQDIRRALGHLAFNQRAALVMRELEGRTYSEIGEILGLSVSAVETLIFRARRALREQLEGSLTCGEAELAISNQVDGRLPRAEKGALRAHLRQCPECATFARSQRAQRAAFKALGAVPLPASLSSLFGGGGGAAVGTAVATKAAAVVAAGALVGGVGYEGAHHAPFLGGGSRSSTNAAIAPVRRAAPVRVAPDPAPVAQVVKEVSVGKARLHVKARPVDPATKRANGKAKGASARTQHPASRGKALGARGHVSHGRRSPVVERQPVAHGNGKSSAAKLKAVPPGQVEKARKLPKRHTRKVPDRARLKKAK